MVLEEVNFASMTSLLMRFFSRKEIAEPKEPALRPAAKSYVQRKLKFSGGIPEAALGLMHKTVPLILGWGRFSWLSALALLFRLFLLCGAALLPLLVRKVYMQGSSTAATGPALGALSGVKFDALDLILGLVCIVLTFAPKALQLFERRKQETRRHGAYPFLATAIQEMPVKNGSTRNSSVDDHLNEKALKAALEGLREEMADLVDDLGRDRITEVTLLVFADTSGKKMKVLSRTKPNEQVGRQVNSWELLAFYVAVAGRTFVVHDFLRSENPFPKTRLTVPGRPPIDYRSVLYLPIIKSEAVAAGATSTTSEATSEDWALGVICVHCAKPYRFWRLGDHKRPMNGFCTVAYARAAPYITLVSKLIAARTHSVPLEVS